MGWAIPSRACIKSARSALRAGIRLCAIAGRVFAAWSHHRSHPGSREQRPAGGRLCPPGAANLCQALSCLSWPGQGRRWPATDRPRRGHGGARVGARALVPGDIKTSELVARISSSDDSLRMPPEGPPLSAEQIEIVRRWVSEGATWCEHWAFQPLVAPAVPKNAVPKTAVPKPPTGHGRKTRSTPSSCIGSSKPGSRRLRRQKSKSSCGGSTTT